MSENTKETITFARVPDLIAKLVIDERTPESAIPIIAWQSGSQIIVEIANIPESLADLHNCDWEGCGSLNHVVRFTVEDKYRNCEPRLDKTTILEWAEKNGKWMKDSPGDSYFIRLGDLDKFIRSTPEKEVELPVRESSLLHVMEILAGDTTEVVIDVSELLEGIESEIELRRETALDYDSLKYIIENWAKEIIGQEGKQ